VVIAKKALLVVAVVSAAGCLSKADLTGVHADAEVVTFPDAEDPDFDATFPDAEEADAGGHMDALPTDGGFNDGAAVDGGFVDSGPPDVGFMDAGFADAGFPDSGPRNPLTGLGPLTRISYGFGLVEGPTWRPDNTLMFTDIIGRRIHQTAPPNYMITVFREPSNSANGLANSINGDLIACEHQTRRVSRTQSNGTVVALADRWQGRAFNSPNDLVVRADDTVYFTDPPYALGARPREIPFNGLFSVTPTGAVSVEWIGHAMTATIPGPDSLPNGIDLSPDELTLYMSDAQSSIVHAFDVLPSGRLTNERTLFHARGNAADGIGVDVDGNLYVATSSGVEVWGSDARYWGLIPMPPGVTAGNIQFGGADRRIAYIAAGGSMYWMTVVVPGAH